MGTRHLIAVQLDGRYRVAQYGQWDGYPSGQGVGVLEFCRSLVDQLPTLKTFEEKLRAASFMTDADTEVFNKEIAAKGSEFDWKRSYPWLSRDAGSDVLGHILDQPAGIRLTDQIAFAGDSLFCEWAYVIDLDVMRLEVFKGFNKTLLDTTERFAAAPLDEKSGYQQVKFVTAWSFTDLPSDDDFVGALEKDDEEEQEEDA